MKETLRRAQPLSRLLSSHTLSPLLLSSALACGVLAGRFYLTQSGGYRFLVWNLFLAWVPYLLALAAALLHWRQPGRWWLLLAPAALWLAFFPNGPYIVTDLIHLRHNTGFVWWYDLGLIAAFAWSGCFLAVASLHAMQRIVRDYLGWLLSWLFALAAIALSGLGVYLGRFVRLNSWDALLEPRAVLRLTLDSVLDSETQRRALGVTLLFAAFLLVCYVTFVSLRRPDPVRH